MYISVFWKQKNGTGSIAQIVDVPDFTLAADKLQYAYEGYNIQTMNWINTTVDKVDITGIAWFCQYTDKATKTKTSIYIFEKTFDAAFQQFRRYFGYDPDSITQSNLTYRNEQ